MAKRTSALSYQCQSCPKRAEAPASSALALLQLCQGCHDSRFAKGMAAQHKADREAAARAR